MAFLKSRWIHVYVFIMFVVLTSTLSAQTIYLYDSTLATQKNAGMPALIDVATGDVLLITGDQTSGLKFTAEKGAYNYTIASGTVTDGGASYSDDVRVLTGGSRYFYKPAASTFNLKNIKFANLGDSSAGHGQVFFNNSGNLTVNLDNVTFDTITQNTSAGFGSVAYVNNTFTLNAQDGGYTIKNCLGQGGAIYSFNTVKLTGSGPVVFENNRFGTAGGKSDIVATTIQITGSGTYSFDGGLQATTTTFSGGNITFKAGSYNTGTTCTINNATVKFENSENKGEGQTAVGAQFAFSGAATIEGTSNVTVGDGIAQFRTLMVNDNAEVAFNGSAVAITNNLTLSGNAKVSIKDAAQFEQTTTNNTNTVSLAGTSTLTVNQNTDLVGEVVIEGSEGGIKFQGFTSTAGTTLNKTGSKLLTLRQSNADKPISGTINLEKGRLDIIGTVAATNAPTLKTSAGTTLNHNTAATTSLQADSDVKGDLAIQKGNMNVLSQKINPVNLSVAADSVLNTNTNMVTFQKATLGTKNITVTGGSAAGIISDDTNTRGEVILNGGTMTSNISERANITPAYTIPAKISIPYSGSGMFLDLDASATDSLLLGTNGTDVRAWNKTGGNAGNKKTSVTGLTDLSQKYTALAFKNSGKNMSAPTAYPQLKTDGDMQFIEMTSDGAHYFGFNMASVQSAFWVLNDYSTAGNQAFLLGNDDGKNYPLHRSATKVNGRYALLDGTYSTLEDHVSAGTASMYLNGEEVANPSATALPTDEWSLLSFSSNNGYSVNTFSRDRNQSGRSWAGGIAELITFTETLSDLDMVAINSYLNTKWNLGKTIMYEGNNVSDFNDFAELYTDYAQYITPETYVPATAVTGYKLSVTADSTYDATQQPVVGFYEVDVKPDVKMSILTNPANNTQWLSDFNVDGTLALVSSSEDHALLKIDGSYTQTGTLELDFAGTDYGVDYNAVEATGAITLNAGSVFDISTESMTVEDGMTFDVMLTEVEFNEDLDLSTIDFLSDVEGLEWIPSILDGRTLQLAASVDIPGPTPGSGVPEPATWILLGLGLIGLRAVKSRK